MRPARSTVVTVAACALIWWALALPNDVRELSVGSFARFPLEVLVLVAVVLMLPSGARRPAAIIAGAVLALLVAVKALDIGFTTVTDETFHALYDWYGLGAGYHVLSDWIGRIPATLLIIGLVLLIVLVAIALVRAVVRVVEIVSDHRRLSARATTAGAVVWALCAASGLQVAGGDIASTSTTRLAHDHATGLYGDYRDRQAFTSAIAEDRFADTADEDLLTGLEGKDVLLVSVESYGRVAVTDPEISSGVDDVLETGSERMGEAGFSARSAYLTAPTFGAGSWLSHATLQSGLWVDSQQRYDLLMPEQRLTLTSAFARAGWRTASVAPAIQDGWPEGTSFYGSDAIHDARSLDYRGPDLGWGKVPDQYTLSKFWRAELAEPDRDPVMAQIDLVSSHHPWSSPPPLVGWDAVGDGSVFDCMPECGARESEDARSRYGRTIEYTLRTITSFVATHGDPDLVVVMVGDHQPWSQVTGENPSRDVPVTIIAHDPDVMDRVSSWGWDPGMRPGPQAPVWRMDTLRDRFLTAFE